MLRVTNVEYKIALEQGILIKNIAAGLLDQDDDGKSDEGRVEQGEMTADELVKSLITANREELLPVSRTGLGLDLDKALVSIRSLHDDIKQKASRLRLKFINIGKVESALHEQLVAKLLRFGINVGSRELMLSIGKALLAGLREADTVHDATDQALPKFINADLPHHDDFAAAAADALEDDEGKNSPAKVPDNIHDFVTTLIDTYRDILLPRTRRSGLNLNEALVGVRAIHCNIKGLLSVSNKKVEEALYQKLFNTISTTMAKLNVGLDGLDTGLLSGSIIAKLSEGASVEDAVNHGFAADGEGAADNNAVGHGSSDDGNSVVEDVESSQASSVEMELFNRQSDQPKMQIGKTNNNVANAATKWLSERIQGFEDWPEELQRKMIDSFVTQGMLELLSQPEVATLQLDKQMEDIFANHYKAHYGHDEYHMVGSSEEQATVRLDDIPNDDCIYSDGTFCKSLAGASFVGASFGGFEIGS